MSLGDRFIMPFPRDLVRAVSKVLGLPEGTVFQHDRQLAEHGYRRSGGSKCGQMRD